MKGQLLIYRPGNRYPITRDLERAPSLADLQSAVVGYIEQVPGFTSHHGKRCVTFCNEEGKLKQLVTNQVATRLWHDALPPPGLLGPDGDLIDMLVGPVAVVVGDDELLDEM